MIVLDASVLIAHLDGADSHHERATTLLMAAAADTFGASLLTLAEVYVGPARSGALDLARPAVEELEVVTVALTDSAPVRLAELRARTGLRLPDCCVLLAAESSHATLATFDDRLATAAADLGIDVQV